MTEKLAFKDVAKSFNGIDAIKHISFQVMEGETLVLIGTSGCGKTTTLKMINRLVEPTSGLIELEGKNISDHDPIELRRSIGYVIQSIGLFPHMTIGENISIVPELMNWPQDKIDARVKELLMMVGLDADTYMGRYPAELSGGQQQRIGVARALAADPPLILMDEPFGALDPITREQLQNEFLSLLETIKKTIVFVTHDIFEAAKLADRLALMDEGQIIQIGTPQEIIEQPENQQVIDFLGSHHFQLSLLMTKLMEIMVAPETLKTPVSQYPGLKKDDSILDALNYFKHNDTEFIPIVKDDEKIEGIVFRNAVRDTVCNDLL